MGGRRELVTRVLDGDTLQTATRKNHRLCGRDIMRDVGSECNLRRIAPRSGGRGT
jgi:hypothetical protein